MRSISKRFPGVLANDRVDFEAAAGEVHALLGENGAGKTTLMNVLTGLYRPDEGEIEIHGEQVDFQSPRDALDAGIGMVHQHFRLVETLTVAENMTLGWHTPRFWLGARAGRRQVRDVSGSLGMPVDPDARVWQLSVGEQQRVEIVKAVFRGSRVLILDEPTAVLTPQEVEQLFATLRLMAREGHAVIVITHKLHEVMAVADRITVLRGGRAVATLPVSEVTLRSLAGLMVGREIAEARRVEPQHSPGELVLEVDGLTTAGDRGGLAVDDVSLGIRAGEILGVAGVAGNGQRELAETVYGIRRAEAGRVRVHGKALRAGDPRAAIAAGVAHVPEDRLGTGLAPSLSIASNVSLKTYRSPPMSRGPLLLVRRMRERALALIRRYDVKAPGPDVPVRNLSGGNLQKLVLGREFDGEPRVLVAGQPTRGLDVGAIETVHAYLREAAAAGVAVLLFSEDLDEIRALADRIVVMYEGALVGELDPASASVEDIGLLMAGGRAR
ncbi:MAG TPA: ABC transporter ATP-binding protein [Gaiellaceae bacterium]|nr:ABC transporter ATP-binding protein [Gaiellaceae bacterium]